MSDPDPENVPDERLRELVEETPETLTSDAGTEYEVNAEESPEGPVLLPDDSLSQLAAEPGPTVVASDGGHLYKVEVRTVLTADEENGGEGE